MTKEKMELVEEFLGSQGIPYEECQQFLWRKVKQERQEAILAKIAQNERFVGKCYCFRHGSTVSYMKVVTNHSSRPDYVTVLRFEMETVQAHNAMDEMFHVHPHLYTFDVTGLYVDEVKTDFLKDFDEIAFEVYLDTLNKYITYLCGHEWPVTA